MKTRNRVDSIELPYLQRAGGVGCLAPSSPMNEPMLETGDCTTFGLLSPGAAVKFNSISVLLLDRKPNACSIAVDETRCRDRAKNERFPLARHGSSAYHGEGHRGIADLRTLSTNGGPRLALDRRRD